MFPTHLFHDLMCWVKVWKILKYKVCCIETRDNNVLISNKFKCISKDDFYSAYVWFKWDIIQSSKRLVTQRVISEFWQSIYNGTNHTIMHRERLVNIKWSINFRSHCITRIIICNNCHWLFVQGLIKHWYTRPSKQTQAAPLLRADITGRAIQRTSNSHRGIVLIRTHPPITRAWQMKYVCSIPLYWSQRRKQAGI